MNPNIVKQYRAHLELTHPRPRTCELISDDLNLIKEDVARTLGGSGVRFENMQAAVGSAGATLIFHPSFNGGKTPLGWISPYEVPEAMSIGATIERLQQAAA